MKRDGAKQKDTIKTPIKKDVKPKAESTPSAFAQNDSHSDSDGLDAVIAELEKSINETMQKLDSLKQRMSVKEKREKAARLHSKLESAQKELQRSKEIERLPFSVTIICYSMAKHVHSIRHTTMQSFYGTNIRQIQTVI